LAYDVVADTYRRPQGQVLRRTSPEAKSVLYDYNIGACPRAAFIGLKVDMRKTGESTTKVVKNDQKHADCSLGSLWAVSGNRGLRLFADRAENADWLCAGFKYPQTRML
jgi:hypothetical protein